MSIVTSNQLPSRTESLFYQIQQAQVLDVILDDSHSQYRQIQDIGKIKVSLINQKPDSYNILWVYPIVCNVILYPVKHQIVQCIKHIYDSTQKIGKQFIPQRWYYLSTISIYNNVNSNIMYNISQSADQSNKKLGKYFNMSKVSKIIPGQGDLVIQGRMGNYVWFTSDKKQCKNKLTLIGDNTSMISIGNNSSILSQYNQKVKKFYEVNDNLQKIFIKSEQIVLKTNTNLNIISNNNCLLNTNKHTYINSDKLQITNNIFNIHSKQMIDINSKKISFNGGRQPAVLGLKLKNLIQLLIQQIKKITVSTSTGPSSPPLNSIQFDSLRLKLNDILSQYIQIK